MSDDPNEAVAVSPDDQTSDRNQSDADQVITVGHLETLISSSEQVTAAVAASLRTRHWLLALGAVLAVFMVAAILQLLSIAQQNKANGERIVSCTTPEGQCFKEGQQRTGAAVATINEVTVWASVCAPDYADLPRPQRDAAIRKCIETGLAK